MDASLRPGLLLLQGATLGVARAQSYGYSYSYSYSYGASAVETACNDTTVGDTRGGANCEDRWAVLYIQQKLLMRLVIRAIGKMCGASVAPGIAIRIEHLTLSRRVKESCAQGPLTCLLSPLPPGTATAA